MPDPLGDPKKEKIERHLALVFIVLAVAFWGYSFISTKVVLDQIPPVSIALIRQFIAVLVLLPIAIYRKELSRTSFRDMSTIALGGFFGTVLYAVFENTGLQYTTASNASMIVSALPVFTLFAEAALFRVKVRLGMILCLLLSMAGVYLVVTVNGSLMISSSQFLGNVMILGAMASWVVYTILIRGIAGKYSSMNIITYQSLASIILFVPFVLPEAGMWDSLLSLSHSTLANLLFLGVFCSALANLFFIYAVQRLGASLPSAFLNLIPVVTIVCGYIFLQERLTLVQIAGMALIMSALYKFNTQSINHNCRIENKN